MNYSILRAGWAGLLCLIGTVGQAQVSHSLSLNVPMSKDRLNNGLLFWGGGLTYGFAIQTERTNHIRLYEAKIGLQAIQRKGLLGVNLLIQPVSYSYGFRIGSHPNRTVYLGPKVSVGYQLQLYPDLQMGHVLWMTNASLAPQLIVQQQVGENRLIARLANSVLSVTSRPERIEPYYFSLRFTDLLRNVHSKPQFSPIGQFNQTKFSVDYRMVGGNRDWSVGYDVNYINYTKTPAFQSLLHSVTLKFYRK